MAQVHAQPGFTTLFENPSVEAMYALSPRDFERFVAYVLRRAGYDVKEVGPHWLRGVDLEMRLPGKARIFGGVECKRFAPHQLVTAPIVKGAKGAPAVDKPGAKPFVITTSSFNDAAYQMAEAGNKQAHLINGSQLVRYINYVRGSRYDAADVLTSLSPEFFAGKDTGNGSGSPYVFGNTQVLTIANNKGGVGKTTTAYYIAAELAALGKRVLLIDLDGQANLTERCLPEQVTKRMEEVEYFPSIAQYFAGERVLSDLIIATGIPKVSVIPSDPFLTLRDLGGSGRPDVEMRFVRDVQKLCVHPIASLGGVPDWIIIDTPPAMSVFTRAGLAAAHYVLAPIRPRRSSLAGTSHMLETLRTMNALSGNGTSPILAVITHWDGLKLSQDFVVTEVPRALKKFGGHTCATRVPIDNQLEALEPGAKTQGARAYEALAIEVLNAVNSHILQ